MLVCINILTWLKNCALLTDPLSAEFPLGLEREKNTEQSWRLGDCTDVLHFWSTGVFVVWLLLLEVDVFQERGATADGLIVKPVSGKRTNIY